MTHSVLARSRARARDRVRSGLYTRFGKRILDLVLVLIFLPLLAPLVATLALIACRDGGPGFYGHQRIGRNGHVFRCWKIRTMVQDADQALQDTLTDDPAAAIEWAKSFKLKNDPRVTRIGRVFRKTSLDELPQIWNVLRGEMSLVGPRPITAGELAFYGPDQNTYLNQRPGITGMWQVHGRSDGCYTSRVRFDRRYGREIGLFTDTVLILRTGFCVLARTGS